MDEDAPGQPPYAAPERVGDQLRAGRERAGLTLAEVAARTRVPLRHLEAIENSNFTDLPSITYASGFAKAYARAVDLDEAAIGRRLRGDLAGAPKRQPEYRPVEVSDPARVPSRGLTIVTLGAAIAILILAALYFGSTLFRGDGTPPVTADAGTPAAVAPVAPTPTPTVAADGQVVVEATDEVWVRLYDADNKTLHQGILQAGQSFDVPAGSKDPMINVGRPDHLRFRVNGAVVSGLDLGRDPIKDVRIDAAALAARGKVGAAEPAATTAPTTTASPTPVAKDSASAKPDRSSERRRTPERRSEPSRRSRPALTETQRANIEAARALPTTGNTR